MSTNPFESLSCTRTWVEINLDALQQNVAAIKSLLPAGQELIAIVKANAYGHGDHRIANALQQMGIAFFAVSNLDEAIGLRHCGITGEILILGYSAPQDAKILAKYNIIQTIYSLEIAEQFNEAAKAADTTVRVHLKLDTGMGRIGFVYDEPQLYDKIAEVSKLPNLHIEGIFTHLSSADMDDAASNTYTNLQITRFSDIVSDLRRMGIPVHLAHIQNSAGILRKVTTEFEASRAGIILYGMYPSEQTQKSIPLMPLMSWKAVVSYVKEVPAGHSISYGRHFTTTEKATRIATIPVGYADGYPRILSGKGCCIVNGVRCPILGNVCMDQMMLDVSAVLDVKAGDVVTVMGSENGISVTAEDLAEWSGTINYEITCNPSRRVPRIYLKDGKAAASENDAMICAEYAAQRAY